MITGLSYGFHDAAATRLTSDGEIVHAIHSERYSKKKFDRNLHKYNPVGTTVFFERPFRKNLRRLYAGQSWKKQPKHDYYIDHHWSHAAAAYYTRPWNEEPVCVVVDAIGEWDTASIWFKKKKVWSMKYPKSLGLFYSAMTKAIGLKPMEDEYITMGLAAFTDKSFDINPMDNYHKGVNLSKYSKEVIANTAQMNLEFELIKIMNHARRISPYLCYGGGVSLNCVANTRIHNIFDKIWILPNPGDAGSSLGAAAAHLDKRIKFEHPYLGYNIIKELNVKKVVKHLLKYHFCGIANGRAEFGPRSLGNRSIIADPRIELKDTINSIKRRQKYRPFAPCILEEFGKEYFEGPMNEYMQFISKAKHDHKSVTHVDGTARVQVVNSNCKSIIRPILEEWYEQTGCPMLLNTSLNIKGKPMVNDEKDANQFENLYGVKVF